MKLMWTIDGANGELRRLVCQNSKGDTLVSLWVGEEVAKDVTAKQAQADWYAGGLEKIAAWKRAAADWQDRAQRAERQAAELTERLDRASHELSEAKYNAALALKKLDQTRAGQRTIEAAPPMPAAHSEAALDIVRDLRWLKEDIEYRLEKIGPQVDRLAGVVARPGPASGGDQVAPAPNASGAD